MAKRPGQNYSEETFGENAKQPRLQKGEMFLIGQTFHEDGKLGGKPVSPNVKTGYPERNA